MPWESSEDTLYQRFKKFIGEGSTGHLAELCSYSSLQTRNEGLGHQNGLLELSEHDGVLGHQRSSGGTFLTEKVIVIMNSKAKGIIRKVWFTEIIAFAHCAVPGAEIDGKPISYLTSIRGKALGLVNISLMNQCESCGPSANFIAFSQFPFPEHLECGAGQVPLKDPDILPKLCHKSS